MCERQGKLCVVIGADKAYACCMYLVVAVEGLLRPIACHTAIEM